MHSLFHGDEHSLLYRQFRPSVPESIIQKVVDFCRQGRSSNEKLGLAIDVGCGSGQCTKMLCPHFEKVLGVDTSETQIREAQVHLASNLSNLELKVGSEAHFGVADESVDLVISSTALHWFDLDKYYDEVDRVLKAGKGVLANVSYHDPMVQGTCNDRLGNSIIKEFIEGLKKEGVLRGRLQMWDEEYENIDKIHYREHYTHKYDDVIWPATLADLDGFVRSKAPFTEYKKKMGDEHTNEISKKFLTRMKLAVGVPVETLESDVRLNLKCQFYFQAARKDARTQ